MIFFFNNSNTWGIDTTISNSITYQCCYFLGFFKRQLCKQWKNGMNIFSFFLKIGLFIQFLQVRWTIHWKTITSLFMLGIDAPINLLIRFSDCSNIVISYILSDNLQFSSHFHTGICDHGDHIVTRDQWLDIEV